MEFPFRPKTVNDRKSIYKKVMLGQKNLQSDRDSITFENLRKSPPKLYKALNTLKSYELGLKDKGSVMSHKRGNPMDMVKSYNIQDTQTIQNSQYTFKTSTKQPQHEMSIETDEDAAPTLV